MKRIAYGALVLVTLATGCYRPEDYILSPSEEDQVLSVTVSATTIAADGISRVTITARLDPRTDPDKRNVRFTTTAGTLIAGETEGPSITVPADSTGTAVVELRSSTTAATARIDVSVASVSRTAVVGFVLLKREDAFDVSVSRTSVPADGFSTAVITVTLARVATLQQRAIKVETSLGTFIATGQLNPRVVTVTADATGRAVVELESEKTVGTARVRVTAFEIPHEFDVTFTPVDSAQIIRVSVAPSSGPADGVTPLTVSATVAAGLPAERRRVTFTSTIGQLFPIVVDADGTGVARASLLSTVTGTSQVTATVDGTTAHTTARFAESLPDRLHVALDAVSLKEGESTGMLVTLIRATGTVSPHLQLRYSAKKSTGASLGSFSGVTLAENSVARATFNVGTTSYLGPVTITVSADGGATGTATLKIVP